MARRKTRKKKPRVVKKHNKKQTWFPCPICFAPEGIEVAKKSRMNMSIEAYCCGAVNTQVKVASDLYDPVDVYYDWLEPTNAKLEETRREDEKRREQQSLRKFPPSANNAGSSSRKRPSSSVDDTNDEPKRKRKRPRTEDSDAPRSAKRTRKRKLEINDDDEA